MPDATRLRDGTVLIAGGYNGEAVNSPELFHPESGTFSPAEAMSTPRRYPSATLLPGGAVLMAGGFATAYGDPLTSSERFLPSTWRLPKSTGEFVEAGTMHTARWPPHGHKAKPQHHLDCRWL